MPAFQAFFDDLYVVGQSVDFFIGFTGTYFSIPIGYHGRYIHSQENNRRANSYSLFVIWYWFDDGVGQKKNRYGFCTGPVTDWTSMGRKSFLHIRKAGTFFCTGSRLVGGLGYFDAARFWATTSQLTTFQNAFR